MEKAPRAILFLLLIVGFGVAQNTTSKGDEFHVGVILDLGTLAGKVARTSISLAVEDFYSVHRNHRTKLVLHIRDSMGSDVQAASAGMSYVLCLCSMKPKNHFCYFLFINYIDKAYFAFDILTRGIHRLAAGQFLICSWKKKLLCPVMIMFLHYNTGTI